PHITDFVALLDSCDEGVDPVVRQARGKAHARLHELGVDSFVNVHRDAAHMRNDRRDDKNGLLPRQAVGHVFARTGRPLPRQFILMPAAFRIGVQRTSSSCTNFAVCAGPESATGSKPACTSLPWKSLSASAVWVAAAIWSMTGRGVPPGVNTP